MPVTSKLHLVPIVKGAVDPKKGIIFRTYYIRPERLQSIIKKLHETPSKPYVIRIPGYADIEKTVATGNLLNMYNIISKLPGGEEAWKYIHSRAEAFGDIGHIEEHRARLMQGAYHYVLTQDKLALACFKQYLPKAVYDWEFELEVKEVKNKSKLKRRKVKEKGIAIIRSLRDIEKLAKEKKVLKLGDIDYGITVTYKPKLKKVKVGKETAKHLSAFFNFININPAKLKVIVSNMITKTSLTDKYNIVGNMILKPDMYVKESEFWIELLPKLINDIVGDISGNYEVSMLEFFIPLLCKLDPTKTKLFTKAFPLELSTMHLIQRMIEGKNKEIVTGEGYNAWLRMVGIVTGFKGEIGKEEIIEAYNKTRDMISKLAVLGAGVGILERKTAWELMNVVKNIEGQGIKEIMNALVQEKIGTWEWLLGQMVFAAITNHHFVPYGYVRANGIDVFSPSIATKLYIPFISKNGREIGIYIKEGLKKAVNTFSGDEVEVYMEINKKFVHDNTLFTHLPPVKVFNLPEGRDKNKRYLKLKVRKEYLIGGGENKVLCIMPVEAISDVGKVE